MASEKVWEGVIRMLRYTALFRLRNHADAEDIAQDTAQITFEKLKREQDLAEKGKSESFIRKYAGGVLFNKTRTYYRDLKKRISHTDELHRALPALHEPIAYVACEKKELLNQLEIVLSTLDEQDKKLFQMFKRSLSNKEICEVLKITRDTLRKRRQRLIRRLRRELTKKQRIVKKGKSNGI